MQGALNVVVGPLVCLRPASNGIQNLLVALRKPMTQQEDPPPDTWEIAFAGLFLCLIHDQDQVSLKG